MKSLNGLKNSTYFTKPLQGRLFLSMREKIVCGVPKERSAETGEAKIRKPEKPKN